MLAKQSPTPEESRRTISTRNSTRTMAGDQH